MRVPSSEVDAAAPLVERADELADLDAELELALAGAGRLVAIEGPPGIGKSRLLAHAIAGARTGPAQVLTAAAARSESDLPYGIVRQLFGSELDADDAGLPALDRLLQTLLGLASDGPVVLAIDDAHWADVASLRFVGYAARRIDRSPILVLLAHRPDGSRHTALDTVLSSCTHRSLRLRALTQDGVASLLRHHLGDDADARFCEECAAITGGNPLLLQELVRTLAAGSLHPRDLRPTDLSELAAQAVSRTVRIRLAELPPQATDLAQAAAVAGDGAGLVLAGALAGLDGPALDAAALALRRVEILAPGDRVAFVHALVLDALRLGLPPDAARHAHTRAAELLEAAGARDDVVAPHLLHVVPGDDPRRRATLRAAGAQALAAGSAGSAGAYLQRALDEGADGDERRDLLLALGEAQARFDLAAAVETLSAAIPLLEDPIARAIARARLASILPGDHPQEAIELGLEGIAEIGDGDPEARRRVVALVGTAATLHPAPGGVAADLDALMDREAATDDAPEAGARMISAVLAARTLRENAPEQQVRAHGARAFGGDWLAAVRVHGGPFALGATALIVVDDPSARRIVDEWRIEARRLGSTAHECGAEMLLAHLLLARGELLGAERSAGDALVAMAAYGMAGAVRSQVVGVLAEAQLERGETAAALHTLARFPASDADAGSVDLHTLLAVRARIRAAAGEHAAALQETLTLGARCAALGVESPALLPWRSRAAVLTAELGDLPAARRLADDELALAREAGVPRAVGRALIAAAAVGAPADAEALLEEARAVLAPLPAPLEQARAALTLGEALLARDAAAAAREPLREALGLATSCGSAPLEARARAALVAAGGRPRRAAVRGPDALTEAERRVAELAAAGRSNREIAGQLFLAQRTVEAHLSRSFRKLGIASRAQLRSVIEGPA